MKHSSLLLHLSLLILCVLHFSSSRVSAAADRMWATFLETDYKEITDVNDPHVVKIAKFAVEEHNKQLSHSRSDQLKFIKVVKGEELPFAGLYRLYIEASGEEELFPSEYLADVLEKPSNKSLSLVSFENVTN